MLEAGSASIDLTPDGELHLIGVYARTPRVANCIRDPLLARALCLRDGEHQVVIIGCDLLCIPEELHLALADMTKLGPAGIFLAATHTHASFGGFFSSDATASMLGHPRTAVFSWLRDRLVLLARRAMDDLTPARVRYGEAEVPGLVSSRRQAGGPHDDRVCLLRLERRGRRPIDLVAASGHPVVVAEHCPHTASADYPGELCSRLEGAGSDPVFLSTALGGVSILFPEFEMDLERHLEMLTGLLLQGHERAVDNLRTMESARLGSRLVRVSHGPHCVRVFSGLGAAGKAADTLLGLPLHLLGRRMRDALAFERGVPLHLVTLGDFCLVGSANELGPTVVEALRQTVHEHGYNSCMVASLADGYAGYLHMPWVYRRRPERGYRFLALYENALAMFGHDFAEQLVAAADGTLARPFTAKDPRGR